jgi:hypothetical protein
LLHGETEKAGRGAGIFDYTSLFFVANRGTAEVPLCPERGQEFLAFAVGAG